MVCLPTFFLPFLATTLPVAGTLLPATLAMIVNFFFALTDFGALTLPIVEPCLTTVSVARVGEVPWRAQVTGIDGAKGESETTVIGNDAGIVTGMFVPGLGSANSPCEAPAPGTARVKSPVAGMAAWARSRPLSGIAASPKGSANDTALVPSLVALMPAAMPRAAS